MLNFTVKNYFDINIEKLQADFTAFSNLSTKKMQQVLLKNPPLIQYT